MMIIRTGDEGFDVLRMSIVQAILDRRKAMFVLIDCVAKGVPLGESIDQITILTSDCNDADSLFIKSIAEFERQATERAEAGGGDG